MIARSLLTALCLALSAPAGSQALNFSISGDYSASFRLSATPTPDFVDPGYAFAVTGVPGFPNSSNGFADLTFFSTASTGGLLISDPNGFDYLFDANGAQLYTGTENAPRFQPGRFALTGLSTPGRFTFAITAVPEPATWALMLAGFALTGSALRVRRHKAIAA